MGVTITTLMNSLSNAISHIFMLSTVAFMYTLKRTPRTIGLCPFTHHIRGQDWDIPQ